MPDNPRGYVRRGEGVLSSDKEAGADYRNRARDDGVSFNEKTQRSLIDESLIAADKQQLRIHHVATENTHVHILASWRRARTWRQARASLKRSLTLRLKRELGRKDPFSENGSRKRVRDRKHFDHLMNVYLPSHSGWKWSEEKGYYREGQ
ncbi:MAG: hypothetical protein KY475_22935 [Planctomycetes bacterium]|nr:hypothetical protein [Planctomycetota bacterium]